MLVEKDKVRETIWRTLEEKKVAAFPLPVRNRIPNFVGSKEASLRLSRLEVWKMSKVIAVNPDSPQRYLREIALREGKILIMSTPRLRNGFLLIEPKNEIDYSFASTIRGAFKFGRIEKFELLPKVDLFVVGSVAVNLNGERIGKGEGYSELEWAILYTNSKVSEETPIVTTVHDLQVVNYEFDVRPYDLPVDLIVTPTRTITVKKVREKPKRIYWEFLGEEKIREIPMLRLLKKNF